MRRLPASSVFVALKVGKQGLRIEFRCQGIISYRVVEAFEPLDPGSCPTPVADTTTPAGAKPVAKINPTSLRAVPYCGTREPDTRPHGPRFSISRDSAMNAHGGKRPAPAAPRERPAVQTSWCGRKQPQPGSCRSPTCCG